MTELGYSVAALVARRLPRRALDPLIDVLAGVYLATHPRRTRAVNRNLSRIWSERHGAGPRPGAAETYRLFARAVLEFVAQRSPALGAAPRVRVSEDARGALARAREAGTPTVLVSGHFGAWERALQWVASQVGGVDALAAPHRWGAVERFFAARRAAYGVRTLPGGRGAALALRRLRQGRWIAALADRSSLARAGGAEATAGGLVPLDPGPVLLAQRAGAIVLPGVSWIEEDGTLGVRFDTPFALEPVRGGIPISQALARLQRLFDDHVRSYPNQWFEWRAARGAGLRG